MHKEIERKFLVLRTDFLGSPEIPRKHFEQAYLLPEALHYEFNREDAEYKLDIFLNGEFARLMLSLRVSAEDRMALDQILFSDDGTPKVKPRIRILDGEEAVLTLKGKACGLSRDEFEVPLPLEMAKLAIRQAKSSLQKTRYFVPIGTRTFEVDVYEGPLQGLATAEVEFSESENPMDLTLPDWVGRDVSEEIEYSNAWLAEFGSCH